MKYNIFQIQLTDEESGAINVFGWDGAIKRFPRVGTYLKYMPGRGNTFAPDDIFDYEKVAMIEIDGGLEDVFAALNGMSPKEFDLTRLSSMHSLSVGDIVEPDSGSKVFMVAPFGFTEISL